MTRDTGIRLALTRDLPGMLAISNRAALHTAANFAVDSEAPDAWRHDYDQTHEMFPWLVATGETGETPDTGETPEVIGFARASPWKGRCAYAWTAETTVYVHHEHHGRGLGTKLYARLIATLRAQGYRTLLGGITQPNPASVRLHESLGFRRVALLLQVGWKFDRWHDVGYWQLQLAGDTGAPAPIRPVGDVFSASCPMA